MTEKRMVFFHTRRLAKEFNMSVKMVGALLSSLGLKRWNCSSTGKTGTTWYWEDE